jgi:dolichol-phosphate mannosyltransferase
MNQAGLETDMPLRVTIVAPFYNEAQGARHFYEALDRVTAEIAAQWDFVFVDDGSPDETLAVLRQLSERDPRISVVGLSRNFGHQAALTAGLDLAGGDVVICLDSDMQHPPELIPAMLDEYRRGAEIVFAVRTASADIGWSKRFASRLFYIVLRRLGSVPVVPGAADFRLMTRPALDALLQMREYHRYLRGMAPWTGFRQATVHYEQPERYAGMPGYTIRKSLRLARHGLFSFSTRPLDWITMLGLCVIGLSMIYGLFVIVVALRGEAVSGWASAVLVSMILGGVQLISIGVIAQYIGLIFEQVKQRPLYLVRYKQIANLPAPRDRKEEL